MRKLRWFTKRSWILIPLLPLMVGGCRHRCHHRDMSEKELAEMFKDRAEDVLDEVDATDQQFRAVNGILDGLAADLMPLKKEHKPLHDRFAKALEADRIDRQEIEAIRKTMMDLIDRATTSGLGALADVGDVLTPEQRRELVAEWRERHR